MSEDEKKAIEHLNKIKSYGMIMGLKADSDIDIVLNLIENNKKELEQEKEKNKELEKENWIMRTVDKQYVSKDKIRDKIKEIENSEFSTEEERDCQCYGIDILQELIKEE